MSSRIGFLINSGCKLLSRVQQCVRTSSYQNEKQFCRLANVNSDHLFARTFSTLNYDKLRARTRENQPTKPIDLFKIRYLRCDNFSNQVDPNKENVEEKLSLFKKFKVLWKNYWYVMLPVHMVTSAFWFGGFYYLVSSGVDVMQILEMLHIPDAVIENFRSDEGKMAGNVMAAFALYKIATPARYTVTIGGTTLAINYLKNRGMIKPANKEQIKKLYEGRKDALKNLKETYQGKMQVTKDDLLSKKNEITLQYKEAKEELERSMVQSHQDMKKTLKEMKREIGVVKAVVKEISTSKKDK